ncbi:1068_t:CDS:2 [Funneliformis geosporum]|uniref:1068_t:CDS:1 n=1 Tax=Funneliformis geosporum TaxID=1117311 RepID=A0A9W4SF14_9GLOM|nr:1068_t:CDS:2 [Funneliformis geosporum]
MFSNIYGRGPSNTILTRPININEPNDDDSLEIYLHRKIETPKGRKVECKLCNNIFNILTSFNHHAKKEHGYKYLCRFCSKVCSNVYQQTSHTKGAHKQFPCDICQNVCWGYNGLKEHFKCVHPGMVPPPASKFNSVDHLNNQPMVVSNVPSVNNNRRRIDYPPVFLHESQFVDNTTMKCKLCNEIFSSNKEFNKHAKAKHDANFICFKCSEVFQKKRLLGNHINIFHKSFCQFCGKAFIKESLDRHVREVHPSSQEFEHEVDNAVFVHETTQEESERQS